MAAAFYSSEEVRSKLRKNEEEIRDLVREGKLREFRDAGKLLYKREDVNALVAEMTGGGPAAGEVEDSVLGNLSLQPSDSNAGDAGLGGSEISLQLDDSSPGGSMSDASAAALEMLSGDTGAGESGAAPSMDLSEGSSLGLTGESGTSIPLEPFEDSGTDLSAGTSESGSGTTPTLGGSDDLGAIPLSGSSLLGSAGDSASGASEPGLPMDLSEESGLGSIGVSGTAIPLDLSDEKDASDGTGGTGTSVFTLEESESDVGESGDKKEDTVITSVGINVFDDEDLEIDADPQAKTSVSDSADESLEAEVMGSGSGLLDLTRESDDTSLGADLWEEVQPGGGAGDSSGVGIEDDTKAGIAEDTGVAEGFATPAPVSSAVAAIQSPAGSIEDPLGAMVTGLLGAGLLIMLVGGLVSVSVIRDVWPSPLERIHENFWMFVGVSAGLAVLAALIGFFVGRTGRPKPAA